ncbi:methylmalonyl Co-A mutase-associated GTPase MeaB [Kiloniella laminariae]|uniref:Methylmalonyl Co-A mutase-associated GTPase MeaB n=1 Tax=Kiloniella laminariae TaxID=454162 RepID=A0ABT4LMB4_9PROT|nr:methylmalonyl Co-A mutase-associated GTPase MeaB [Kiloniella laminariae]MCZ4282201.1 methylmalonyl Co-A mutase-associated GTPase MeaB [Kiloniella laminariae]
MKKVNSKTTSGRMAEGVLAGERRALARAITLIESTRRDHRSEADVLLEQILPHSGKSIRIGISGVPGVGKSTFIEAFGMHLIKAGHRVAVLAIDPSSQRTGGSILGDKTRMELLSRQQSAFIRPSPAGKTLGGVARRTREAMLLCEAAGFDVILVETVGVGQSETAVSEMVDMFLLLLLPGGGDELQGIKKGIMELADMVVVNKADGDLIPAANRAAAEYHAALGLMRPSSPNWKPAVKKCSALQEEGIAEIWEAIGRFREKLWESGEIPQKRAQQAKAWMWNEIRETLVIAFREDPQVAAALHQMESGVIEGQLAPASAANRLLNLFLKPS